MTVLNRSSIILTSAALLLTVCGLALLFAPAELSGETSSMMAQLFGASLLGLGAADWIARRSSVGGIYGRSVVVANLFTFGISALVVIRAYFHYPRPQLIVVAAAAAAFAVCFGLLL